MYLVFIDDHDDTQPLLVLAVQLHDRLCIVSSPSPSAQRVRCIKDAMLVHSISNGTCYQHQAVHRLRFSCNVEFLQVILSEACITTDFEYAQLSTYEALQIRHWLAICGKACKLPLACRRLMV